MNGVICHPLRVLLDSRAMVVELTDNTQLCQWGYVRQGVTDLSLSF